MDLICNKIVEMKTKTWDQMRHEISWSSKEHFQILDTLKSHNRYELTCKCTPYIWLYMYILRQFEHTVNQKYMYCMFVMSN